MTTKGAADSSYEILEKYCALLNKDTSLPNWIIDLFEELNSYADALDVEQRMVTEQGNAADTSITGGERRRLMLLACIDGVIAMHGSSWQMVSDVDCMQILTFLQTLLRQVVHPGWCFQDGVERSLLAIQMLVLLGALMHADRIHCHLLEVVLYRPSFGTKQITETEITTCPSSTTCAGKRR